MKIIAYYISDYGYGHAARSIAMIRELLERDQRVSFIICTSYATSFLRASLPLQRVFFREVETDVGYFLKKGSIEPDKMKLRNMVDHFVGNWEEKIERERSFLQSNKVNLVLSDISPLPFEAAPSLEIPSVGISNFTWYSAYEKLIDEQRLERWKRAYEHMNYFMMLAGSKEREWTAKKYYHSFYARKISDSSVERIRSLVNPTGEKIVIFFGLGMKMGSIDIHSLPLWESKDCVFIVSSNVDIHRENVYVIPKEETESQHYIAASDVVITKAGWGTVSEAVVYQVPLLIVNREEMQEDQHTISFIIEHGLGEVIEWDNLINYKYEGGKKRKKGFNGFVNEVGKIGNEILQLLV